jgi:signal transduction histidine kinase
VPETIPKYQADAEKALNLLIHDLRAPLSVAHGYLRLLRENRLSSTTDRERAFAQTMEALGKMSRLCSDASAYSAPAVSDGLPLAAAPLDRLVALVRGAAESSCSEKFPIGAEIANGQAQIRALDITRLADAIATIFCAIRRAAGSRAVALSISHTDTEMRFLMGDDHERALLVAQPPAAFDPWRGGHTIALPLACRTLLEAGGRVWSLAAVRGAGGVALPLEVRPS